VDVAEEKMVLVGRVRALWCAVAPGSDELVGAFEHSALLYEGEADFTAGVSAFLREGIARDEAVMVAVAGEKSDRLADALGQRAGAVSFVDMERVGRNPGRICSAWQDFLDGAPGRPARGVGEPIWAGRTAAELVECELHESLLNLVFADAADFRMLCPYDAAALAPAVLHEATCSHPAVVWGGVRHPSRHYRTDDLLARFQTQLPAPAGGVDVLAFDRYTSRDARELATGVARPTGLDDGRVADLELALAEVVNNSVQHGGGHGVLRVWCEDGAVVCEVRDGGRIRDPLVGRRRAPWDAEHGRGLWMAHQLVDLVQVRSDRDGTVVRLQMRIASV
jgi:anti-sigma regulatory factor (Ser/Thr protein kinase)